MIASPLSGNDLAALRQIDTATVSNALDALGSGDKSTYSYSSLELRCQFPELEPMVGYAVTCVRDYSSNGRARAGEDRQLYEAIRDAPKPVIVVCQYVGPDRFMSNLLGDMMATAFQQLGTAGVVTDGGVRDLAGIRERAPQFQVFACGAVAATGQSVIADVGAAVSVCGLAISPGDILHGDANGVVTIPRGLAQEVPARSEQILERERQRVEFLLGPEFSFDELRRRSSW